MAPNYLARELSHCGWRVIGIEPDPEEAHLAGSHCKHVVGSYLDSVDFWIHPFQEIVLGDFLKHLPDPGRILSRSNEHLDPHCVVTISVPTSRKRSHRNRFLLW